MNDKTWNTLNDLIGHSELMMVKQLIVEMPIHLLTDDKEEYKSVLEAFKLKGFLRWTTYMPKESIKYQLCFLNVNYITEL